MEYIWPVLVGAVIGIVVPVYFYRSLMREAWRHFRAMHRQKKLAASIDPVAEAIFNESVATGIEDVGAHQSWLMTGKATRQMYRRIARAALQAAQR